MKKLLVVGIVMAVLLTPTAAFAEETVDNGEWQEFRLEQVAEYTPENYDEWARLFGVVEEIKSDRESSKLILEDLIENVWGPYIETLKGDVKILVQEYSDELKIQVEAGEITREDAKVLFEAYKIEVKADLIAMKADRESNKEANQLEKEAYDVLRNEKKTLNLEIKALVEAGETEGIAEKLNAILVINQSLELHALDVNDRIDEKIEALESF